MSESRTMLPAGDGDPQGEPHGTSADGFGSASFDIGAPPAGDGRTRRLSHEVGTPLNASLGLLEVLLDGSLGPLTPEVRQSLHDVRTGLEQVARQMSLLLLLIEAQNGAASGPQQVVPLAPALERAWQARPGWRGGERALEVPPDLGVRGEREVLEAVAGIMVGLYRSAAGVAGQAGGSVPCLQIAWRGGCLETTWSGLDTADLPAVEVALLEALLRRQEATLERAGDRLRVCWPAGRLTTGGTS